MNNWKVLPRDRAISKFPLFLSQSLIFWTKLLFFYTNFCFEGCFRHSRQWPEVYDLCHTFLHVAQVKKPTAMRELHATCKNVWQNLIPLVQLLWLMFHPKQTVPIVLVNSDLYSDDPALHFLPVVLMCIHHRNKVEAGKWFFRLCPRRSCFNMTSVAASENSLSAALQAWVYK